MSAMDVFGFVVCVILGWYLAEALRWVWRAVREWPWGEDDAERETLDNLADEIREWGRVTFAGGSPKGAAEHLRREAMEIIINPYDGEEWADAFHLVINGADRAGVDLAIEVRRKLEINKRRKWGKPDADGVVEHVRDERAA